MNDYFVDHYQILWHLRIVNVLKFLTFKSQGETKWNSSLESWQQKMTQNIIRWGQRMEWKIKVDKYINYFICDLNKQYLRIDGTILKKLGLCYKYKSSYFIVYRITGIVTL